MSMHITKPDSISPLPFGYGAGSPARDFLVFSDGDKEVSLSYNIMSTINDIAEKVGKLAAVKTFRHITQFGLLDSKDAVEFIADSYKGSLRRYTRSSDASAVR